MAADRGPIRPAPLRYGGRQYDHLRRDAGRTTSLGDLPGLDSLIDPRPSPEEAAISRQELVLLALAVQELPGKCRVKISCRPLGESAPQIRLRE